MNRTLLNVKISLRAGAALHLSPRAGRGRIALAIRVRGRLLERSRNCFQNARHIAEHVVVPEPQNSVVAIDKPFVANHVARIVRVLTSVHLNNETAFTTDQINRVRPIASCRTNLYPLSLRDRSRYHRAVSASVGSRRKRLARPVLISSASRMWKRPLTRMATPSDLSPHAGRG